MASLSHLCSPWNSYLPLSCHFWSCPEVLCLIPDCRKLRFFFFFFGPKALDGTRMLWLFHFIEKASLSRLIGSPFSLFLAYQNPLLLCEFCTNYTCSNSLFFGIICVPTCVYNHKYSVCIFFLYVTCGILNSEC